jgi:hypothetical protein
MSDSTDDDSFELWDLRVEAVVPHGAKAYCGAREGDYFELRGEMLTLPPGQGFSIYSIARCCRCSPPSSGRPMPTIG